MANLKALDETLVDLRDEVQRNILSLQDLLSLIDELRILLLPELPDAVIQHILSFLPLKDACRASCVSKTWLNVWQMRPILEFNEGFCYLDPRNSQREGFLNYGNRVLQRYREEKIGIEKFKLCFRTPIVSEWIQVALENGVKKLALVADSYSDSITDFVLPRIIFEAKSPLMLTVKGSCQNSKPRLKLRKGRIQCQHVKSLHLCRLQLDYSCLQNIISSCPMIEDLRIWECTGFGSFKVTYNYYSKLKKFTFRSWEADSNTTVEVEAPNLEFLSCSGFYTTYRLRVNASQNLKELKLSEVGITDEFFLDFQYRFPLLEDLTIQGCRNLRRIRMSSASLRTIHLSTRSEKELHIDAPNMTRFELYSRKECLDELQIDAPSMTCFEYRGSFIGKVSFTNVSSHCCSQIKLFRDCTCASTFFVDLHKFLKNFSQSKIYLRLDDVHRSDGNIFEENIAMYMDSSVAVQVHQLIFSSYIQEKFLDGLLWSCHPKTIRVVNYSDYGSIRYASSPSQCSMLAQFISKYLIFSPHIKLGKWSVKQMKFQQNVVFDMVENVLELEMET